MYLIILLMSLGVLAIAIVIITEMNDSKAKRKRLYIGLFSIVIFLNVLIFNYKISLTSMVGMDNSSYIHEVVISRFGQEPMVISDQKFLNNEMYGLLKKVEVNLIPQSGPVKFEDHPYGIILSYNHYETRFFLTNNLLQYNDKYGYRITSGTAKASRVMIHELGHVLGLDHPDTSCTDYAIKVFKCCLWHNITRYCKL